jgi:predicted RNase H-like nuclease (RuvC/YqgF family)
MLKKSTFAVFLAASLSAPLSYAEKADNPFYKPSERNPVEEVVDQGPMCSPEATEAFEGRIESLEEENTILSLQVEESANQIAALQDKLQKEEAREAQKFIGIVNDQAIFFDEINKVYIYKNKNEIDGELLK